MKGFHMPLRTCACRKKEMVILLRGFAHTVGSIRGVCGTNTGAYLSSK